MSFGIKKGQGKNYHSIYIISIAEIIHPEKKKFNEQPWPKKIFVNKW
jgi:hypothetical protein